jgi:hypothetical protein
MDRYVVHVDCEGSTHDLLMEYCVHYGLKYSRGVGESEEHYHRFKESLIGYECCLILVFRYNLGHVVSLTDVDHGD